MKISQELYNSGALRRERLGPSNDWGFDAADFSLHDAAKGGASLLRGLIETLLRACRSGGSRQPRRAHS